MITIEYVALPEQLQGKIKGMSTKIGNDYRIIIDSTRYHIEQRFVLGHELAHIYMKHHESNISTTEAEYEADRNAWKYYRLYRDGLLEREET